MPCLSKIYPEQLKEIKSSTLMTYVNDYTKRIRAPYIRINRLLFVESTDIDGVTYYSVMHIVPTEHKIKQILDFCDQCPV